MPIPFHSRLLTTSCLITLSTLAFSASAIVVRHDKPAAQYLASKADFPPLATFYNIGVHGTLIEPQWVLTAAHTVFCLDKGQTIQVGDEFVKVQGRYSHPAYKMGKEHDLALIQLEQPVLTVKPAQLYRQSDETDQVLWFIGAGGTGTGLTGETVDYKANNGVLRKVQNQVMAVTKSDLRFVFESGDEAQELEGVSGNGDSGGPAYLQKADDFYLLGVSSRLESWFKGVGEYGVKELYTRVSSHADWIDQVVAADEQSRAAISSSDGFLHEGMTVEKMPKICASLSLAPKTS